MSSAIWTAAALSSEARGRRGQCWRVVEAQHFISTLKLVDTLAEQQILEELLEASKPAVPGECRDLDFLLFTPFRYEPYPAGSRFRRAGLTPGVFYAAEHPETAIAETVFYRLLFFAESPDTPWPGNPAEFTAFAVSYATERAIDLTGGALGTDADPWQHLTDYSACQALADAAREVEIDIIRYRSVRDPSHRCNVALLRCRAFASPSPTERQSWRLHLSAGGAAALCEAPRRSLAFDRAAFAADPRIEALRWDRPAP